MKKLVISIVTWNSESSIKSCVESVLAQSFSDFELIIVDNNSADQTSAIVQSFNDPRITFIPLKENTGFCGGHNLAISRTESEFVLLVNPDIILSPDYTSVVLKTIEENEKTGTVCGLLVQSDLHDPQCVIDSAGLEMKRSCIMGMIAHGELRSEFKAEKQEVFGADGALPLYRRAMIKDIAFNGQFFDELFFAHKEDWDVSWRSHLYGWKTIFDPAAVAIHPRHFKPGSLKVRSSIAAPIKIHAVKNQLILILKNEPAGAFLLNSIFILPRQLMTLIFILLKERTSLKAYHFVFQHYGEIMARRKVIQNRRTT